MEKFLCLVVTLMLLPASQQDGCVISPFNSKFSTNQPLVFWEYWTDLMYPEDDSGSLTLAPGDVITIVCVDGSLTADIPLVSNSSVAICVTTSELIAGYGILNYTSLDCGHTSLDLGNVYPTGVACGVGEIYRIRIKVDLLLDEYVNLAEVCYDNTTKSILHTSLNTTKYLGVRIPLSIEELTTDEEIYGYINVTQVYLPVNQSAVVNTLLGLEEDSNRFLNANGDNSLYLVEGVLANQEFFAYTTEQLAVTRYINSVPIWRAVSENNLQSSVKDIQQYINDNKVDLQIYAGAYGISTLPHAETNEETDLYLSIDENDQLIFPVPSIIWRVVYNPEDKSAVALVVVNNPFQVRVEDIVCQDISSSVAWLVSWDQESFAKGLSYACSYSDLKESLPHIPDLDVDQLLS